MWSYVLGFSVRLISFPPIPIICIIWLNIDLFFLKICYQSILVFVCCDDPNTIVSACDILNWYGFYDLLHYCWLYSYNSYNQWIGSISFRGYSVPLAIVFWPGYIVHVLMITVLGKNTNGSNTWWKSYCCLKFIFFVEGVV